MPLTFKEAPDFFEGDDIIDHLSPYSVTRGMPRYLALLGRGNLIDSIASKIVDPNAPLFNEVPSLLAAELIEVGTYYSILSELSGHPKARGEIAEHSSIEFEHTFRRWLRQQYPQARLVGSWWGNSANVQRAAGVRLSEEIDAVGLAAKKVVVLGEAKWTNNALSYGVLNDLIDFKIPALIDGGLTIESTREIVLTTRSGFSQNLQSAVGVMPGLRLIEPGDLLRSVFRISAIISKISPDR